MRDGKTVMMLEDAADSIICALALIALNISMGERSVIAVVIAGGVLSLTYRLSDLNVNRGTSVRGTYIGRLLSANIIFFLIYPVALSLIRQSGVRVSFIWISCLVGLILSAVVYLRKHLTARLISLIYRRTGRSERVLLVGDNPDGARQLISCFQSCYPPREAIGAVGEGMGELGCTHFGDISSLECALEECSPDAVIFTVREYDRAKLAHAVSLCDDACAAVYFLPVIYGFLKSGGQVEHIGELPLINLHSSPLDLPSSAIQKRVLDILGSLALIILTLPAMLLCAVGVRLSSDGPILFRQRRVGKGGREFVMLKFRSMRRGEGENNTWSRGIDKRKTRFGNFMRRTSLDELPQLFNVLVGDMSLVGPRPEIPVFVNKFKREIPLYMLKHYVKPGITGLAQIRGLRGDTSLTKRIESDLYYIENWSLWLDLKILLLTPLHAINKKEKYTEKKK